MANSSYTGPYYDKWAELYKIGKGQDGKYIAPEKTENMSDTDYQIGQTLYRAYLENQRLDSEYGKGKQALADNKREAEISADVTLQRMQKHLPQQLVKQGLYGTGVSEDAYLKLQNQYQKSVSDAAKSYNDGLSALESVYQQNKNSVWEQANTGVNTVLANAENEQKINYVNASEGLASGSFNNEAEVEEYLKSFEGKVSQQDYKLLKNQAISTIKALGFGTDGLTDQEMRKTIEDSEIPTGEDTSFDSLGNGDEIKVTLNNTEYIVESTGHTSAEAARYANNNKLLDGALFVHGDNNDVYIYSGGVAYKVVSKGGIGATKEKYRAHFNDVRQYLLGQGYGENLKKYNEKNKTAHKTSKATNFNYNFLHSV